MNRPPSATMRKRAVAHPEASPEKTRSLGLDKDPKMEELKQAQEKNEQRRVSRYSDFQTSGAKEVDGWMKELATAEAASPAPRRTFSLTLPRADGFVSTPSSPTHSGGDSPPKVGQEAGGFNFDPAHPKARFREYTNHELQRLVRNLELDRDDSDTSHKARCKTLDRIYEWYWQHQRKPAAQKDGKSKRDSFFLTYEPDSPVSPGSLRPKPSPPSSLLRKAGHIASLPNSASAPNLRSPVHGQTHGAEGQLPPAS